MTQELTHNTEAQRYELHDSEDGLLASAEYAVNGDSVAITRVFTRPTHRGRGLAAVVTEYAVDQIVADGRTVLPVCSYAQAWFEQHPERGGVVG